MRVPQDVIEKPNTFGVPAYRCVERYNYVWVALEQQRQLGEALKDIASVIY